MTLEMKSKNIDISIYLIIIGFVVGLIGVSFSMFKLEKENDKLTEDFNQCISQYSSCVGDLKGCANALRTADDNTEFIYKLLKHDSR